MEEKEIVEQNYLQVVEGSMMYHEWFVKMLQESLENKDKEIAQLRLDFKGTTFFCKDCVKKDKEIKELKRKRNKVYIKSLELSSEIEDFWKNIPKTNVEAIINLSLLRDIKMLLEEYIESIGE